MYRKTLFLILVFLTTTISFAPAQQQSWQISVDLKDTLGPLTAVWASFGYDEPNATTTPDGLKLLGTLSHLGSVPVYVRTHNLLTTGDGSYSLKWGSTNVYTEDSNGHPVYRWKILDSIFDAIVSRGMKPVAEIGFMPEALSAHPTPYRHHWKPGMPYDEVYTGWAYPPTDYHKWSLLIYQWVAHAVKRYGRREVESWYWEVWNEPNISYWKGTPEAYFKLYDYTARAVKKACPGAPIGGPAVTGPGGKGAARFLEDFLKHCDTGRNAATGKRGAPLDFISFHAKGSPRFLDGHVRMNLAPELRDAQQGFRIVASTRFKNLPVFITEFDPEGCAACGMTTNPENAYRNGTMYSSYTAAVFCRLYDLAAKYRIHLVRATSWAFEFEGQPWFDGFRSLATHGIDKPVLNIFQMYGMMQGERIGIHNPRELPLDSLLQNSVPAGTPDVHALASEGNQEAAVMVWNYADADVPRPPAPVTLTINHIPSSRIRVTDFRIDKKHSNAYAVWKQMGSPQRMTESQYKILEQSGQLQMITSPHWITTRQGTATLTFSLPAEGVSLVKVNFGG